MKQYLWETHMHTAETSRCAQSPAADMVRAYKNAGYHGVVITDHFLNGNNRALRGHSDWQAKIDVMVKGYKAAKEAGDALGLAVLCGCEFTYQGGDFLTYGIGEAFWRDQPDLAQLDVDTYVRRVHAAGGLVSQAHPFRMAWYMPDHIDKRWDIVDAFEVFNGSHDEHDRNWDDQSLAMAREHDLLQTAGSDAHSLRDIATAAMVFPEPFDTDEAFLDAIRAGNGSILRNRA